MTLMQKELLKCFEEYYGNTKNKPRAIYGVGKNTDFLLDNIEGYNIVCVMDSKTEGQNFKGYPVLSCEEVVGKIEEIIVIANLINCEIVYHRIENIEKHNIIIKNYEGVELRNLVDIKKDGTYNYKGTHEELVNKIENADVVSFDMFDTIIQRKVLLPVDIFSLVEYELEKENIYVNFKENRMLAEQNAMHNDGICWNYHNIYNQLQKILDIDDDLISKIKDLEFEIELKYIIPRKSGVSYLNKAVEQGKTIYITSDMYYPKEYLEKILTNNLIKGYKEILVSCDFGKSKCGGDLYDIIKEKEIDKKILHIGDNFNSDIKSATKKGLDVFYFISVHDMIIHSNFSSMYKKIISIADSCLVGDLFSKIFDSPFVLSKYSGRLYLDNTKVFADMIIIPLFTKAMLFCIDYYSTKKNPIALYIARDGYIFYNIHERLKANPKYSHLPTSKYFLGSRRALTITNLDTEEDILELMEKLDFQNNNYSEFETVAFERFGIEMDSNSKKITNKEDLLNRLILRKDEILDNAKKEKLEYLKYIDQFDFKQYEEIILFDIIVFLGNAFIGLNKLLNQKIYGLAITDYRTGKKLDDYLVEYKYIYQFIVDDLVSYSNGYREYKTLINSFFIYENICASNEGQFIKFENGEPVYRDEPKKTEGFLATQKYVEMAVADKMLEYDEKFLKSINPYLIEEISTMFTKKFAVLNKSLSEYINLDDPLRNTKIEDMEIFNLLEWD